MDGHHRIKAFKTLKIKKIPCFLVDYFSDEIQLKKRRKEIKVNKNLVIENALSKKLFPFKTTNHVLELFRINYKLEVQKCKK